MKLEGDYVDQVFTKANLCATIVSYVNYVVKKLSNKPSLAHPQPLPNGGEMSVKDLPMCIYVYYVPYVVNNKHPLNLPFCTC